MNARTLLFLLCCLLCVSAANASLIGDSVRVYQVSVVNQGDAPSILGSQRVLIQEGVPELFGPPFTIDIEADTIGLQVDAAADLSATSGFHFFGFAFTDLDWIPGPSRIVGITQTTNIAGWDLCNVCFGADQIDINLAGLSLQPGDFLLVQLDIQQVPLPPAIVLMLGAMVTAGTLTRKKARHC